MDVEISRKLDEIATAVILEGSEPADPDRWADSISASSSRPHFRIDRFCIVSWIGYRADSGDSGTR